MSFTNSGQIPGQPAPSAAQSHKIQIICGTIAGIIADSNCSDIERKAIVTNLVQQYGTVDQLPVTQRAINRRPRRKRQWQVK